MEREFEKYTSCDAADAMVAVGGANDGGAIPFVHQQSGRTGATIAGPAYTVEYAPQSDPRPAVSGHYIDSVPAGAIVLIATAADCQLDYAPYTSLRNSLYGGLMSTRAKYLGAAGTVVLGLIRDIAEHRRLDYPVYSYGLGSCAPNKLAKVVAVNDPIVIGDRTVRPGDVVVADENGVVIVPSDKANACLDYIPLRVKADELAAEDIAGGIPAATAQKNRRQGLPK